MEWQELNGYVWLQPQTRLDSQGGLFLKEQLVNIPIEPHKIWVMNLATVDFMDSSGLGAVVTAVKFARSKECRLVMCRPSATARLVFEITQLDRVFEIIENIEEIFSNSSISEELLSA